MDKYDTVLDLIEHPDRYSADEIEALLSDPEANEIYNLLCKTGSAMAAEDDNVDVDAAWQEFGRRRGKGLFHHRWSIGRAASIGAVALTSLAAVALGITVAVKSFEPKQSPIESTDTQANITLSADTPELSDTTAVAGATDTPAGPKVFENATLAEILGYIACVHGANVEYRSPTTAQLRLYYKFDPTLPLAETVGQLNNFEQIDIRISGNKIIVD